MKLFGLLLYLVLAALAARGSQRAYVAFLAIIPLSFPAGVGFRLNPRPCELTFDLPLAFQSLSNYPHILLFALVCLVTGLHIRARTWPALGWSMAITMLMGVAMELAQGLSGDHHCKSVDLIPDFIGALIGLMIALLFGALRSKTSHRKNARESAGP